MCAFSTELYWSLQLCCKLLVIGCLQSLLGVLCSSFLEFFIWFWTYVRTFFQMESTFVRSSSGCASFLFSSICGKHVSTCSHPLGRTVTQKEFGSPLHTFNEGLAEYLVERFRLCCSKYLSTGCQNWVPQCPGTSWKAQSPQHQKGARSLWLYWSSSYSIHDFLNHWSNYFLSPSWR